MERTCTSIWSIISFFGTHPGGRKKSSLTGCSERWWHVWWVVSLWGFIPHSSCPTWTKEFFGAHVAAVQRHPKLHPGLPKQWSPIPTGSRLGLWVTWYQATRKKKVTHVFKESFYLCCSEGSILFVNYWILSTTSVYDSLVTSQFICLSLLLTLSASPSTS